MTIGFCLMDPINTTCYVTVFFVILDVMRRRGLAVRAPELKPGNGDGKDDGIGNGNDNSDASGNSGENRNSKNDGKAIEMAVTSEMERTITIGKPLIMTMVMAMKPTVIIPKRTFVA